MLKKLVFIVLALWCCIRGGNGILFLPSTVTYLAKKDTVYNPAALRFLGLRGTKQDTENAVRNAQKTSLILKKSNERKDFAKVLKFFLFLHPIKQ